MKYFILIGCLALAACQTESPPDPLVLGGAAQKATCEKDGGTLGHGVLASVNICFHTPRDAGKTCTQNSDCEGMCLAQSQSCAPIMPLLGCNDVLVAKGQSATLCVD